MSKSNKEKKDKLHRVKSAKDKRKENKTFLKNIKTNYKDIEFLESLESELPTHGRADGLGFRSQHSN